MKYIYNKQYKEIIVDSWQSPGKTVAKQLKKLKESPSKFKILNIVAHGGQFANAQLYPDKIGMQYSIFTDVHHMP